MKNTLYDRLFRSIDNAFTEKAGVIPREECVCFSIDTSRERAEKEFNAYATKCRKKYGTDEGITFYHVNFQAKKNEVKFE